MEKLIEEYRQLDKESQEMRKEIRIAFKEKNIDRYKELVFEKSIKSARMDTILEIMKISGRLEEFVEKL